MFLDRGIWLPDGEQHFNDYFAKSRQMIGGKATYQWEKIQAALRAAPKRRRVAVDVGAHVGLWSMHLAQSFRLVHAFEPIAAYRECFRENVTAGNVQLHESALGAAPGTVSLAVHPIYSGSTRVDVAAAPGDRVTVPLERLDAYELEEVDLLKVDCEGFEYHVLVGAEATLLRCKPVIVVEQRKGLPADYGLRQTQAVEYLESLGAQQFCRPMIEDYFLWWPAAKGAA